MQQIVLNKISTFHTTKSQQKTCNCIHRQKAPPQSMLMARMQVLGELALLGRE